MRGHPKPRAMLVTSVQGGALGEGAFIARALMTALRIP